MSVTFINSAAGEYQCMAVDIVNNSASSLGASYIGASLYVLDTGQWFRIAEDLTLYPIYTSSSLVITNFPATQNVSGSTKLVGISTVGGTGYIATGSFTGNGLATYYPVNSNVFPQSGTLTQILNAFRVAGGSAYITDVGLTTSASGVTITPRVHFYSASTVTIGPDSGSHVELYADDALRLGYFTMPAMSSASGSATDCSRSTTVDGSSITHLDILAVGATNSTSLWCTIETRTAFTTSASQNWFLKLRMNQN